MKNKYYIFILLLLVFSSVSFSKWTLFDKRTIGFDFGDIRDIKSDNFNNIWTAAWLSDYRFFDGKKWYYPVDFAGSIGYTNKIIVDKDNNIWITGDFDKVSKYNWSKWETYEIPGVSGAVMENIACDSNNNIWLGTIPWESDQKATGIFKFDGTNFTSYSFLTDSLIGWGIFDIVVDKNNNIWAIGGINYENGVPGLDHKGKLFKYDGKSWSVFTMANSDFAFDKVGKLAFDTYGNLWITGYGKLQKFDGITWSDPKEPFKNYNYNVGCFCVYDMVFDKNNTLWAGTSYGLIKWDGNNWTYWHGQDDIGFYDLPGIFSVHIDKMNRLWVGSFDVVAVNDELVGIVEQKINEEILQIIPNPSSDKIIINIKSEESGAHKITIYNTQGFVQQEITLSGDLSNRDIVVDVSNLPSGLYFVKVQSPFESEVRKFIVMH